MAPAGMILARTRRIGTASTRHSAVVALVGLAVLVALVYLPYARRGGWYLDDWAFYATMQEAAGTGFGGLIDACQTEITGGRAAACVYHATVFGAFGGERMLYHLFALVCLWAMAALSYGILRACRMPILWAMLAAVALVVYPSSDATRLWPVAAVGQYVMVVYLAALLLGIRSLQEERQGRSRVLLVISLVLTAAALITYEIVIPIVALNGLVYVAALRTRAAVARGAVDFLFAGIYGVIRLTASSTEDVFVIERTRGETLDRALLLLQRAWDVWHETFLPGVTGLVTIAAVLVASVVVLRLAPPSRGRIGAWLLVLGAAATVVAASALSYVSANDYYVPDMASTANRINLAGSVAGATAFVAIAALAVEVGRYMGLLRVAQLAVAGAVLASGSHMLAISSDHKERWEESWRAQQAVLTQYPEALRRVPLDAVVIGFDAPQWEAGFVPVFETSWDLEGALRYTTDHDPALAYPANEGLTCGPVGVVVGGAVLARYEDEAELWFVSPTRRAARHVASPEACERTFATWGRAPFWGRTVTDPKAVEAGRPIRPSGATKTPSS